MHALIHISFHISCKISFAQAFNFALPLLAVTQWGDRGGEGTWQVVYPLG